MNKNITATKTNIAVNVGVTATVYENYKTLSSGKVELGTVEVNGMPVSYVANFTTVVRVCGITLPVINMDDFEVVIDNRAISISAEEAESVLYKLSKHSTPFLDDCDSDGGESAYLFRLDANEAPLITINMHNNPNWMNKVADVVYNYYMNVYNYSSESLGNFTTKINDLMTTYRNNK